MMASNRHLVPNVNEVASETLDGEAIIINMATGSYYSAAGTGGVIWDSLCAGDSLAAVCARVQSDYDVEPERAERDVVAFAEQLLSEGLILDKGRRSGGDESVPAGGAAAAGGERAAYTAPSLEIYRDMADMLALDPPMPGLKNLDWTAGAPKSGRDG